MTRHLLGVGNILLSFHVLIQRERNGWRHFFLSLMLNYGHSIWEQPSCEYEGKKNHRTATPDFIVCLHFSYNGRNVTLFILLWSGQSHYFVACRQPHLAKFCWLRLIDINMNFEELKKRQSYLCMNADTIQMKLGSSNSKLVMIYAIFLSKQQGQLIEVHLKGCLMYTSSRRKRDRLGKDVGAFIFPYCSRSPDRVSSKFYLFCKGRISLFNN